LGWGSQPPLHQLGGLGERCKLPQWGPAAPWDRQTDGSRYSKMPPLYSGGIIMLKRALCVLYTAHAGTERMRHVTDAMR